MISVEEAYRRLAAEYDAVTNRTRDLDAKVLREAPLELAENTVLELGCGTGKNTAWLAATSREVIALDLSEDMLAKARTRIVASNVRFTQHDLRTAWPLADASVDMIVGNLVLEHIADLQFVFAEMRRVLGPGGEAYLAELHPFRQLLGRGLDVPGVAEGSVEAYLHNVSDYLDAAFAHGFTLLQLGERYDERDRAEGGLPRLLTLRLARDPARERRTPSDALRRS